VRSHVFVNGVLNLEFSACLELRISDLGFTIILAVRAKLCYSRLVMTQKSQKIIKTGNSAAVTIPSKILKSLNLQIGDKAEALMDLAKGAVTYTFPEIRQLRLGESKRGTK